MVLPSIQLEDGQSKYKPSLSLKLSNDPDREVAILMTLLPLYMC
jgi:hypothetical protein